MSKIEWAVMIPRLLGTLLFIAAAVLQVEWRDWLLALAYTSLLLSWWLLWWDREATDGA